jgi:copper chaperone
VSETITYHVPAIHCDHCAMSIREEVSEVEGVSEVDVDLETKAVTVRGQALEDAALRAAIEGAGYTAT